MSSSAGRVWRVGWCYRCGQEVLIEGVCGPSAVVDLASGENLEGQEHDRAAGVRVDLCSDCASVE